MNNLIEGFNDFAADRLTLAENKMQTVTTNEFVDKLRQTLNREQLFLLDKAVDFEANMSTTLEGYAYQQGFCDGITILNFSQNERR